MKNPWASFCISTFKRPSFIQKQVDELLHQTFPDFEIVISDNDPEASGREAALSFHDDRVKYFYNGSNLGMIASFNKSIERAGGDYVVMVTDDDPVEVGFLAAMHDLHSRHPGFSLYGGFRRKENAPKNVEIISPKDFLSEILDPHKTPWFLWSSCAIDRKTALQVNGIPDYGSPHLADHAFITLCGSIQGAVILNKEFSTLNVHDSNFSKFNFQYYVNGCEGFYSVLNKKISITRKDLPIIKKHLGVWFIGSMFNLKRYYTVSSPNKEYLIQIDQCAKQILAMPFMRQFAWRFLAKAALFRIKKRIRLL